MTDVETMLRGAAAEVQRATLTVAPRPIAFERRYRSAKIGVAALVGATAVVGGALIFDRPPETETAEQQTAPSIAPATDPVATVATVPPSSSSVTVAATVKTHLVIDPPPTGTAFRSDYDQAADSIQIYTQDRPDPENGPWMVVTSTSDAAGGSPMIGDPEAADVQFFDLGRGRVSSTGLDPAEVRRLIVGAETLPDGRRSLDAAALPKGLVLSFDGYWVSDIGLRSRDGGASEVAYRADPVAGSFVRLLVADDPTSAAWRSARLNFGERLSSVTETMVGDSPGYLRFDLGVRVLSWHDGTRWLQLVADGATDDELIRYATAVRQADESEWAGLAVGIGGIEGSSTEDLTPAEQATVGPPGSPTTPIVEPTNIGSLTLSDGTQFSISAAAFGTLTLSAEDGFVTYSISAGAQGAVAAPMRVNRQVSPAAATGDLVYGIVVAGSTVTIRDNATGEEIPVALTNEAEPINGFVGFAARLPSSTTYATLFVTDPITQVTAESNIGY